MNRQSFCLLALICLARTVAADQPEPDQATAAKTPPPPGNAYEILIDPGGFSFDLTPVGLTSKETGKESIGASYDIQFTRKDIEMEQQFGAGRELDEYPVALGYQIDASFNGTLTESKEDNPLNFQEAKLSLEGQYLSRWMLSAGGEAKYEVDQGLDNRQLFYGAKIRVGRDKNLATLNDLFVVVLRYGRVDPGADPEREAILGTPLKNYDRGELEAHWQVNLTGAGPSGFKLSKFEVNYRYFQEVDADNRIKEAGIDNYRLLTFLLRVNEDWSFAYSSGELPFNRRDDRIFQLGYSFQFQ